MPLVKTTLRIVAGLALATFGPTAVMAATPAEEGAAAAKEECVTPGDPEKEWDCPHDYYDLKWKRLLKTVEDYHLHQGIDEILNKRYKAAFGSFKFILFYFPNHPKGLELMAELSILTKKPEVADEYYRRAFRYFPDGIRAAHYSSYAEFLIKSGRYKDAIEAGKTALAKSPDLPEAHYNLGRAYFALNDYERANAHAQKAYAKNYPLTDLREKLIAAKAWKP